MGYVHEDVCAYLVSRMYGEYDVQGHLIFKSWNLNLMTLISGTIGISKYEILKLLTPINMPRKINFRKTIALWQIFTKSPLTELYFFVRKLAYFISFLKRFTAFWIWYFILLRG